MDHTGVAIAQGSVHFPGPGHSGSKVHHVGAVPDGACISVGEGKLGVALESLQGLRDLT